MINPTNTFKKDVLSNLVILLRRERFLVVFNVLIMATTFYILALFLTSFVFSQTLIKNLSEQAQISVFFKDDFPEANILSIKENLEADPRVLSVIYVSKEDAYKIFTELNKDEPILLESVTSSILPASLELKAKEIEDLSIMSSELRQMDGVEEVQFLEDVIEKFKTWAFTANVVGLGLVSVLAFNAYAVILMTIRMVISSKKTELSILKLVGATDSYVKSPMIQQSILFSLMGAFVAFVFFAITILAVNYSGYLPSADSIVLLTFFSKTRVTLWVYLVVLFVLLHFSGFLLGYFGSWTALRRYLKY
ncbi:MAG: permease-like cell division protein FtsX [Patescibacteria group bacterium]